MHYEIQIQFTVRLSINKVSNIKTYIRLEGLLELLSKFEKLLNFIVEKFFYIVLYILLI